MLFAEASERLQIVQGVLTLIGTLVTAFLAYKTVQLQAQASMQAHTMREVRDVVRDVKVTTDGITSRLVEKAEQKGVEEGRRVEIERIAGSLPGGEAVAGDEGASPAT